MMLTTNHHHSITMQQQVGQYEQPDKLYQALCHRRGNTLTVVAEYYRKAPWGFLGSVLEAAVRA